MFFYFQRLFLKVLENTLENKAKDKPAKVYFNHWGYIFALWGYKNIALEDSLGHKQLLALLGSHKFRAGSNTLKISALIN